ncbi:hypothetical protein C0992_003528 [Termitomyces sp. T32_za158]|nr:hypothetical protein C0992_003528 [Termitomyces sp. T32_za158]
MDVRSKKTEPFAHSEDQEDELLSIVAIKSASKVVVGTQIGVLSIFNRSAGWGDCVDRIPGHPHSVDVLCTLPSDLPDVDTTSTILTGSSDGYVRAIEILPTKLLGVVADHGEWPVERIAIGNGTSQLTLDVPDKTQANVGKKEDDDDQEVKSQSRRRWWVGSVGHEETLRLTDLEAFFSETRKNGGKGVRDTLDVNGEQREVEDVEEDEDTDEGSNDNIAVAELQDKDDSDEDSDQEEISKAKKRKHKPEKNPLAVNKKGKNTVDVSEVTFFDDL